MGGVTHRVLCTWWLQGLAVKGPWLALGRLIIEMPRSPCRGGWFLAGKAVWVLNICLPIENADYCMLGNEWV